MIQLRLFKIVIKVAGALTIILLCIPTTIMLSCTGIRLKTKDGGFIYARNMFYSNDLHSQIIFVPRDYEFKGTTPHGESSGLAWKAQYAVLGANVAESLGVVDGINEHGLAGGYFMSTASKYPAIPENHYANSIAWYELLTWILTNFMTIEEIKQALPHSMINDATFKAFDRNFPAHLIIHDALGNSIIIEYDKKAQLHILDNPSGAIANHAIHQRKLITTSTCGVLSRRDGCAATLSHASEITPIATAEDAIAIAFEDIGTYFSQSPMVMQWRSAADTKNKRYHLYTSYYYASADFITLNPETQTKILTIPINQVIPEAFRAKINPIVPRLYPIGILALTAALLIAAGKAPNTIVKRALDICAFTWIANYVVITSPEASYDLESLWWYILQLGGQGLAT